MARRSSRQPIHPTGSSPVTGSRPRSGCRTARCTRRTRRRPSPDRVRSRRDGIRGCRACPSGSRRASARMRCSTSGVHSRPIASNTPGMTSSGASTRLVVVDVHERGAAGIGLFDVEGHQPVDVLADELQHVATGLVRVGVGDVLRCAACGQGCSSTPAPAPGPDGSPRSGRRGAPERWRRARADDTATSAPSDAAAHPTAAARARGRGTRTPPAGRHGAGGSRGTPRRHGPEEAGVHEGLVENGQTLLRTLHVGEVERVDLSARRPRAPAGRRRCSPRAGVAPTPDRRRRRDRSIALPGAQHAQPRVLIEQVLEVGGAGSRETGEEDRWREGGVVDTGSSATYRSTSMRLRSATASMPHGTPSRLAAERRRRRSCCGRPRSRFSAEMFGVGILTSVSASARSTTVRRSAVAR